MPYCNWKVVEVMFAGVPRRRSVPSIFRINGQASSFKSAVRPSSGMMAAHPGSCLSPRIPVLTLSQDLSPSCGLHHIPIFQSLPQIDLCSYTGTAVFGLTLS
jgi:hypothetical protein